jgi:hypothetical protein
VRDARVRTVSLETPVGDTELGKLLPGAPEIALPDDGGDVVLDRLDARAAVLELRFGLGDEEPNGRLETARPWACARATYALESLALQAARGAGDGVSLAACYGASVCRPRAAAPAPSVRGARARSRRASGSAGGDDLALIVLEHRAGTGHVDQ